MRARLHLLAGSALVLTLWAGCDEEQPAPPAGAVAGVTATGPTAGPGPTATSSSSTGGAGGGGGAGGAQCNPVTNQGCERGEACDTNFSLKEFVCFQPPNDNALCEPCGQQDGWCQPTHTCVEGFCAKYCCDDGDCGPAGVCDTRLFQDFDGGTVGVCLARAGSGGGASATHDCMPPDPAPSLGACFGGGGGAGGAGGRGGSGGAGGSG